MDVSTYSVYELTQTIEDDRQAVRNEVELRSDKLAKKILRMKTKLAQAQKEQDELFALHRLAV